MSIEMMVLLLLCLLAIAGAVAGVVAIVRHGLAGAIGSRPTR